MAELKSWHRQKGETDTAYHAFKTWLELPPPRSFEKLYALGFNISSIPKWRDKNDWYNRSVDYDNDLSERSIAVQLNGAMGIQQTITAAAIDDYARLRKLWERSLARIEKAYNAAEELWAEAIDNSDFEAAKEHHDMMDKLMAQMASIIHSRSKLETMGRTAAHLPSSYGVKRLDQNDDEILPDVMTLTFRGPVANDGAAKE